MIHKEITDKQWKSIIPHLPKPAKTGRPRADDRTTINGILFVLTVGCRWEELPEKYGSKSTAHLRLQDCNKKIMIIHSLPPIFSEYSIMF